MERMMESEGGRSCWPEWRPRGAGSTGATVFFSVGEERRKEIEREKEKGGCVCVYISGNIYMSAILTKIIHILILARPVSGHYVPDTEMSSVSEENANVSL